MNPSTSTKPVIVIFATRHGHCAQIAGRVLDSLRARGVEAQSADAARLPARFRLDAYEAAILISPIHLGKHLPEIKRFVVANLAGLQTMPTALLSVSLSQAGAEGLSPTSERRAQAGADASRVIKEFLLETGWQPLCIRALAGALLYTRYNFVLRFVMKRIAGREGGPTDVRQDREYTDWPALDNFCGEFARQMRDRKPAPAVLRA